MNQSDLGIRLRQSFGGEPGHEGSPHQATLTDLEKKCVDTLEARGRGIDCAYPARDLAYRLNLDVDESGDLQTEDYAKRNLRELINHLIISHNIPIICRAGPGGGYFLPDSEAEVEEFYRSFHRRAMTGLVKASRGKKAAFVDIVGQLSFAFDSAEGAAAIERLSLTPDADPVPAWVQLVTRFLDKISAEPDRYAAEIRRIQGAYGDIFVPLETVRELKSKTAELQDLLARIAA